MLQGTSWASPIVRGTALTQVWYAWKAKLCQTLASGCTCYVVWFQRNFLIINLKWIEIFNKVPSSAYHIDLCSSTLLNCISKYLKCIEDWHLCYTRCWQNKECIHKTLLPCILMTSNIVLNFDKNMFHLYIVNLLYCLGIDLLKCITNRMST